MNVNEERSPVSYPALLFCTFLLVQSEHFYEVKFFVLQGLERK